MFPKSFYKTSITLILKSGKYITQKVNCIPILPMNTGAKFLNTMLPTKFNNKLKGT